MKNSVAQYDQTHSRPTWMTLCLHLLAALLLILTPILLARGQKPADTITVSDVATRSILNGTVVSITADGSLSRAQTWQDRDGFHVIIPDAGVSDLVKTGKGYKVRRTGSAIEILLETKPGTPIEVQSDNNHLNLTVNGKLESSGAAETTPSQEPTQPPTTAAGYSLPTDYSASANSGSNSPTTVVSTSSPSTAPSTAQGATQPARAADDPQARQAAEPPSTISVGEPEDEGIFGMIFSGTGVVVVVVLAVVGLLAVRRFRSKTEPKKEIYQTEASENDQLSSDFSDIDEDNNGRAKESNLPSVRNNRGVASSASNRDRKVEVRQVVSAPASLYGAYRIDQEVGKLVLGQAHRMDVLSSRASEDRRAIQTSLIKTLVSAESGEDEKRRARGALEEYGFVARESANLMLAPDAFDRTSAARTLGEIGSAASLPFLLEALYDVESIVRNQAVVSIGELKVPSAIGALLDMARKHPDVPASLVSRALSSCSVEGLEFFDAMIPATSFLGSGSNEGGAFEFTHLEPATSVEELPDSLDGEALVEALAKAASENIDERAEAVKSLAQFSSKSSVDTLVAMARQDQESTIRALAVSSLGFIDHESVFPAVLIGMADESREVRAAAARALSRLSFDRSAAYVTLIQSADDEILRDVAQACVKAGIVSQNIDRLASGDRRQAYEAFSLISVLTKAHLVEPILDAIENHTNQSVRLSAVHLLVSTGEEFLFEQLQQLALKEGLDEEVKTALLEGMYRLEQARPTEEAPVDEFVIHEHKVESENEEQSEENPVSSDYDVGTESR